MFGVAEMKTHTALEIKKNLLQTDGMNKNIKYISLDNFEEMKELFLSSLNGILSKKDRDKIVLLFCADFAIKSDDTIDEKVTTND